MNIYSVDLNLLIYLEALLEELSVSRAARRVGITQPAMSNALSRLRDLFEDPLFRRTARGIVPTPRATQLSGSVRKALVEVRGLLGGQPAFDPATAMRAFRLAMTDYAELVLLGKLAQQLRRQAPGVQILVRRPERIFIPPEQELETGAIDAAIGFYPDASALDASTHATDLFDESNVCIARRGNPLARKKWTAASFALAPQGGVFYRAESRGLVDNLLSAKGLRRQLLVTTPHFLSLPFLVAESDLLACVPEGLALRFRTLLPLEVWRLPFSLPPFHMRLLWHDGTRDDPSQCWLRALVLETASQVARERGKQRTPTHLVEGNIRSTARRLRRRP